MFSSDKWFGAEAGFYNSVATQSLLFDDGSSAYLSRTPSSAGNRRTFTFSAWIKRGSSLDTSDKVIFGAGTGNSADFRIRLSDTNFFDLLSYNGSSYDFNIRTNQVFRDVSAWYHILVAFDTTQGTSTDRIKIYVNGTQLTSFSTATYPSQNFEGFINNTSAHALGRYSWTSSAYFDGYMAEVNLVDGTALDPTYFGESKNGAWIPIDTSSLTFGTNGFRLQFKQTGTGTASASTIGADTSGNNNHFTSSGIVASDCAMPDSPENNFCTYNPLDAKGNDNTFSEGNLKVVVNAQNQDEETRATFGVSSGKWYWEHRLNSTTTTAGYFMIGLKSDDGSNYWTVRGSDGEVNHNGTTSTKSVSYTTNSVVGVYLDMDNGKWYVSVDGSLQNSANLTNGTGFLHNGITGTVHPFIRNASSGGTHTGMGNFGQDSTFGGLESAGGYSDANGSGDFHSAVTSPYLALCSANLPEPTISPNADTQADDHFNTVLISGNSGTQAITGVGFQPDWSWNKTRNVADNHILIDSSRGDKALRSNEAIVEYDTGVSWQFNADGFTMTGTTGELNYSGRTYVSWNWKANGGTTSSNTDGSITSTVQANTTAGFSIVTYTGTGSNATVGHGIGKPDIVIVKRRTGGDGYWTYWGTQFSASTHYIYLNITAGTDTGGATITNSTFPSSTVFSIGTSTFVNGNTDTYVAYCFHSVEGYSKFGSYVGNYNNDGPMIFTGFTPKFVLIKDIDQTYDWQIFDTVRSTINGGTMNYLEPNTSDAENVQTSGYQIDILSNGFKIRTNWTRLNNTNNNFIYMAFAETPFKYANAR